ncbi:BTAD domain-containing putative transcriptional regulator [Nonomuraea jabiensis]|uniref:AfsR/SARP family transcriptional regulator n=1 Tax=Nonomuraea jabiensis TaxID=882448 RepID=UPI003444F944
MGHEVIKIPSARQRITLAALLTRPNQVISADELAEVVWDGTPSAGARTTLRSYVMRLRRSIGPVAGTRIGTREPGYYIELTDHELDLRLFDQRFQRGRQAERVGRWQECAQEMSAALELWRGDPLSDVPAQSLLRAEVPRLVEIRLQALESRIDALLHLGHHDDVICELIELVVAHPLRERFVAQLMLALYRAGRQAEALDTYSAARHRLVTELGIEPSGEVQALHQRILASDPLLMPSPPPVVLNGIVPARLDEVVADRVNGLAPRLLHGVERRPASLPVPVPRQLPPTIRDFTGRRRELVEIVDILKRPDHAAVPIVHLHGPPGVGKTSLAVLVAHRVADTFSDGQLFIPCTREDGAGRDAEETVYELLRTLGVEQAAIPSALTDRAALFRSLLADKRMLVLIDDAQDSEQILPLLPGASGCVVVVTSRRQNIHLPGAHLFELQPLDMDESLHLIRKIIGSARVGAELPAAARIARACEGIPLALRTIGDRLATRATWSLSYAADMLTPSSILDTLIGQDAQMRAAVVGSYEKLGPDLQRAFRYLALAGPHDFSGWTASVVLRQIGSDHLVEALRDRSLLLDAGSAPWGRPRYKMLNLLRQYACELLAVDPEFPAALEHVLTLWTELADFACSRIPLEPIAPDYPSPAPRSPISDPVSKTISKVVLRDPSGWLEREWPLLLEAVELAIIGGMSDHALSLAIRLHRHLTRYHPHEAREMWRKFAAVPDERIRQEALFRIARMCTSFEADAVMPSA